MNKESIIEVLLVEDNDDDALLAVRSLKKYNLANKLYRVYDGEEALDFIFAQGAYQHRNINNTPRVILLDLKMPKKDGLEVLRAVREDKRTRHIPVVILTSSKEDRDIAESYNLGVNSYIVKPVDFQKFAESIRDIGMYWLVLNEPPQ
jgi:two-component system, response regulator